MYIRQCLKIPMSPNVLDEVVVLAARAVVRLALGGHDVAPLG
jgi:hypothetical protein